MAETSDMNSDDKNPEETMSTAQTPSPSSDGRKSQIQLQDRYGRIAISAVLAALPYGKDSKPQSDDKSDSRN